MKMPLKLVKSLEGHTDRIWTLAWNSNGTLLASSGCDKTIRMWAKVKDKLVCVSILTESHRKSIRRLCWSPCGQYLASASFDSTICIWKRDEHDSTWTTVVNLEGHENEVKSVAWSSDGCYLASCGRDRTVWIWEKAPVEEGQEGDDDGDSASNWDCSDVKSDHTKDVKHIIWHPKFNILVSCSYDDTVKFFHKAGDDWKCYETLTSHTSTVWSADFSPTGEYLVTCSDDKTVRIWKNHSHHKLPNVEPNSWKCISVLQGYHSRSIYDVSWNKHNNLVVSASGDNSLVVYRQSLDQESTDQTTFTCIHRFSNSHDCDVNSVEWNPKDPHMLVSAGDDCKINIWHYEGQDEGMKPVTVLEELLNDLGQKYKIDFSVVASNIQVINFSILQNLIKSLQQLQNLNSQDDEKSMVEKLFDLKISESFLQQPVKLSNLCFAQDGDNNGRVEKFSIEIRDIKGALKYTFNLIFTKFELSIPRRSIGIVNVNNELFLMDKTGDLYKITETGNTEFLLGHLFMLSGVGFVVKRTATNSKFIKYIISSDRDEKIRISCYPNTYNIERYCFGHEHFVRRLLMVNDRSFISIDQQNNACLWNLEQLDLDEQKQNFLKPLFMVKVDESVANHMCLEENYNCKIDGQSVQDKTTVTVA